MGQVGTRPRKIAGNDRRVKHGGYRQVALIDWRTREARFLREIESGLVSDLGGSPSTGQLLIVKRAAVKSLRCAFIEHELLTKNGEVPPALQRDYLRWARELREDLKVLGLERRAKPVQDLSTYLAEKYS